MAEETILVIDDEEAQREALAGHLQNQGYQVLQAPAGDPGLELLQQHLVDLILTDFRMPDMDGLAVLSAARHINPEVEVIIITAYGSVGGAVDAMREGACHYLTKPIDLDEFDGVVRRALERHHLISENRMRAKFNGIRTRKSFRLQWIHLGRRPPHSRRSPGARRDLERAGRSGTPGGRTRVAVLPPALRRALQRRI